MKKAIYQGSVIVDIANSYTVDGNAILANNIRYTNCEVIDCDDGVDNINYSIVNGAVTYSPIVPPKVVPQEVTPRQARLALLQATLLDDVELLLANDKAMQIWWEYSLDIKRDHEHIIAMGTALGMTDQQLDDLFILAGSL